MRGYDYIPQEAIIVKDPLGFHCWKMYDITNLTEEELSIAIEQIRTKRRQFHGKSEWLELPTDFYTPPRLMGGSRVCVYEWKGEWKRTKKEHPIKFSPPERTKLAQDISWAINNHYPWEEYLEEVEQNEI